MNKISYRVMKLHSFENSTFYRIACDCTDQRHDLVAEVEVDKEGRLWLTLNGNFTIADWWGNWKWHCKAWKRIKMVLKLLFTGYFEANSDFLIFEENHIDSIISFLYDIKKEKREEQQLEDSISI